MENEKKIAPNERIESGFSKEDALGIFEMKPSKKNCISFYTKNIKAWKANFYAIRKKERPDSLFTFSMNKEKGEGYYNVWKIK